MHLRSAFSMIELIFAIVVIGVAVISLPMMTQVTSKGLDNSLVQEAIFAASAELNQAVSYHWDEMSLQDGNSSLSRVVNTDTLECNASTNVRKGHIHRRCLNNTNTRPTNSTDGDFLDSAAHGFQDMFLTSGGTFVADSKGYKHNYQSIVAVGFSKFDTVASADKNIKKTAIEITKSDQTTTVTKLSTYSANIGEVDYHKRRY